MIPQTIRLQALMTTLCLLLSMVDGTSLHARPTLQTRPLQGSITKTLANTQEHHKKTGLFLDTVVIGAIDKVTARTSTITLRLGEPQKIGTLIVKALKAWKSNPEEEPEAKVFFDVYEQKSHNNKNGKAAPLTPVFRGWMFQSNRSISSLEHPVYDIWIQDVSGNPHDGLPLDTDTTVMAVDETLNDEIDGLIDQLMTDEPAGNPIAIEPAPESSLLPQDIPSQNTEEALAKEPLSEDNTDRFRDDDDAIEGLY